MAKDIGIDLGTANVLINIAGKGIVLNEPSVVAVDTNSNKVVAVGTEAYKMVGRTPGNIRVIRPLKNGVIADFDITEAMLSYFINKLNVKGFMSKPNILICAPTGVTSIEQKAIIQAAEKSGGGRVYLDFEPKVAAVGAGLDIFKPQGNMVIDIGGGTTDIAVLSMGEVVTSRSLRWAGDKMNQAVINYIKNNKNLLIGQCTAEQIKIQIGTAFDADPEKVISVRGRDIIDGLPKQTVVSATEIQSSLEDGLMSIVAATKEVLEKTPPELSADIIDRGIMLTGGGALLTNIDKLITYYLQVPVLVADNPLEAVANGTGILLKNIQEHSKNRMKKLLINMVIIYQKCISPLFPPTCRYYPTCSKYMITAISKHGCILGIIMGVARIIRCNPFVRGGVDPVPDFFTIRRNPHPEKYMDPIIAKKFYK